MEEKLDTQIAKQILDMCASIATTQTLILTKLEQMEEKNKHNFQVMSDQIGRLEKKMGKVEIKQVIDLNIHQNGRTITHQFIDSDWPFSQKESTKKNVYDFTMQERKWR
jgi:hypothetical protein